MMSNSVVIEGEVVRDFKPLGQMKNGGVFIVFSIVWKTNKKGRKMASFFNVMAFDTLAETTFSLARRGDLLKVKGYLKCYKGKGGQYKTVIVAEDIEIKKIEKETDVV